MIKGVVIYYKMQEVEAAYDKRFCHILQSARNGGCK